MKRTDMTSEDYERLLKSIAPIIMERGLKAMTMDFVAARLGMSKRTLYEIFGSKNHMAEEVMEYMHRANIEIMKHLFDSSPTVLEAWIRIIEAHRDMIERINVSLFRDMDTYYKDMKGNYCRRVDDRNRELVKVCLRGVEQGVFRPDVNYSIQTRIFEIQMESLKRMEELFPPDITVAEVYDAICVGFLRSIVTPEGMRLLDSLPVGREKVPFGIFCS